MGYFFALEYFRRFLEHEPRYTVWAVAGAAVIAAALAVLVVYFRRYFSFIFKSLWRNPVRTVLTGMVTMALVFVVTLVWTVLVFLDIVMTEKSKDLKAIVTEKFQIPSQMPFSYDAALSSEALSLPEGQRPSRDDLMSWQFYGGTLDPTKMTRENLLFFFALEPSKLRTMMDDLDNIDPKLVERLEAKRDGAILGIDRLKAIDKQVGERFKVTSFNYKGIDLEFEIVGVFPEGRYDNSAVMNRDYLNAALDDYKRVKGTAHPLAERSLNLFWMRLPTTDAFDLVAGRVGSPGKFASPAVKCETASSGISSWLEGYQTLIWGMRWFLMPTVFVTMAMVVANAISISVRERIKEMAVLKVLGFGPGRIIALVVGEALLIGGGSGLLSAGLAYGVVHHLMGGIKFPVAFFPKFDIYLDSLWWGLVLGGLAGLLGSIVPAWSARRVKVSEVFAKVV